MQLVMETMDTLLAAAAVHQTQMLLTADLASAAAAAVADHSQIKVRSQERQTPEAAEAELTLTRLH
jgi:hypothetical protein